MNFKKLPFSDLNKEVRKMDYIKEVYDRRVQAEITSYKDFEDEKQRDTIQVQDILTLDEFST